MIARARLLLALAVICRSQASSVTGASADACPLEHYETSFLQVHKAVKFASNRSGEGVFAKEEVAEQVPEILTNVHEEVKSSNACSSIADEDDEHMAGKAFIDPSTQSDFSDWQIVEEASESMSADIEKAFNQAQVKLPGLVAKLGRFADKVLAKIRQALSTMGSLATQSVQYMRSPDNQKVVLKVLKATAGLTLFVAGTFFSGGLAPALIPALSMGSNILFSALEAGHALKNDPDVNRADVGNMFMVNVAKGAVMMTIGFGIENPFDQIKPTSLEEAANGIIGFADLVCGTANDWLDGENKNNQGTKANDQIDKGHLNCVKPPLLKAAATSIRSRFQAISSKLRSDKELLPQFVEMPEFGAEELPEPHFCEVKRKELDAIRAEFEERAGAPPSRRGAIKPIKDSVERETAALKIDPNWKPPSWGQ